MVKNGDITVLAGQVSGFDIRPKVAIVRLNTKIYNRDKKQLLDKTIEISFWNSDDGTKCRRDAIEHKHLKVGSYVVIVCKLSQDNTAKATGYFLCYPGSIFTLGTDNKKRTYYFGYVYNPVTSEDKHTLRLGFRKGYGDNVEWINLSLFDNNYTLNATNGYKVLKNRSLVLLMGDAPKDYVTDTGRVLKSAACALFEVISYPTQNPDIYNNKPRQQGINGCCPQEEEEFG